MSDQYYQERSYGGSRHQKPKYQEKGQVKGTQRQHEGMGSQSQQVYVPKKQKKPTVQEESEQQTQVEQSHQDPMSNLTAEQKFTSLFGTGEVLQQPEQQQHQEEKKQEGTRKRLGKDWLLKKFTQKQEIQLELFSNDRLSFIDIFSMQPQNPENLEATEVTTSVGEMQSQFKGKGRIDRGKQQWRGREHQAIEEEENEEEPEWVDFDPKKETGTFFGRKLADEDKLRDQVKKEKERNLVAWGSKPRRESEDEFEQLVRREREEARKRAEQDIELKNKAEGLATDLELSGQQYSDIDMIVERKISKQASKRDEVLNEDELEDLFGSLKQQEEQKKQQDIQQQVQEEVKQKEEVEIIPEIKKEQLPQQLQQQIQDISKQQKQVLQTQKLVQQQRPQFSALQNISNLFQNFPVVTYEKHRIKLQGIQKTNYVEQSGELFKDLMSSINPFSKYLLEEITNPEEEKSTENLWTLDSAIFQKPQGGEVNQENLVKSSAGMFVIYKFCNDPFMKVKSQKYTNGEFVQIKDLFPKQNLLQTSPLNVQLQQYNQMMPMHGAYPLMKPVQLNRENLILNATQEEQKTTFPQPIAAQNVPQQQQQQQQEQEQEQKNEEQQYSGMSLSGNDLATMQLKSLLGFNPK